MQIRRFSAAFILVVATFCGEDATRAHQRPSSSAPAKNEMTIDGRVLSCWQGSPMRWNGVHVRLYTMEQSEEIRSLLKALAALPTNNEPATLQQGASLVNRLAQAVRNTPTFLRPVKTDREGRFSFQHIPASIRYFLLAGDETEEGDSFFGQEIADPKPGNRTVTMIAGAASEEECKKQTEKQSVNPRASNSLQEK